MSVKAFSFSLVAFLVTFVLGLAIVRVTTGQGSTTGIGGGGSDLMAKPGEILRETFPIEIPASWRVDVNGKEFGGWRQTGVAPSDFDMTMADVAELMTAHGFTEVKRVDMDETGSTQVLIQYEARSGDKVLWMLWDLDGSKTGFSWGRVR